MSADDFLDKLRSLGINGDAMAQWKKEDLEHFAKGDPLFVKWFVDNVDESNCLTEEEIQEYNELVGEELSDEELGKILKEHGLSESDISWFPEPEVEQRILLQKEAQLVRLQQQREALEEVSSMLSESLSEAAEEEKELNVKLKEARSKFIQTGQEMMGTALKHKKCVDEFDKAIYELTAFLRQDENGVGEFGMTDFQLEDLMGLGQEFVEATSAAMQNFFSEISSTDSSSVDNEAAEKLMKMKAREIIVGAKLAAKTETLRVLKEVKTGTYPIPSSFSISSKEKELATSTATLESRLKLLLKREIPQIVGTFVRKFINKIGVHGANDHKVTHVKVIQMIVEDFSQIFKIVCMLLNFESQHLTYIQEYVQETKHFFDSERDRYLERMNLMQAAMPTTLNNQEEEFTNLLKDMVLAAVSVAGGEKSDDSLTKLTKDFETALSALEEELLNDFKNQEEKLSSAEADLKLTCSSIKEATDVGVAISLIKRMQSTVQQMEKKIESTSCHFDEETKKIEAKSHIGRAARHLWIWFLTNPGKLKIAVQLATKSK